MTRCLVAAALTSVAPLAWAGPAIHYVNFADGTESITEATRGHDSAPANRSAFCTARPYPAYTGSDAERRALVCALDGLLADFDIVLTTTRPLASAFSMTMVGPATCARDVQQPLNCRNANRQNVSFSFRGDPLETAHAIGHQLGLEHVDVACDIMGLGHSSKPCPGGRWGFMNVSGSIPGGGTCRSSTQNSYQRVMDALGPWPGGAKPDPWTFAPCEDLASPSVSIIEPPDGSGVPNTFYVKAVATDDCSGVKHATLTVPGLGSHQMVGFGPFTWDLGQVPDTADQAMTVEVEDFAGRRGATTIHVTVGDAFDGGTDAGEDAPVDQAPERPDGGLIGPGAFLHCGNVYPAPPEAGCGCRVPEQRRPAPEATVALVAIAVAGCSARRSRIGRRRDRASPRVAVLLLVAVTAASASGCAETIAVSRTPSAAEIAAFRKAVTGQRGDVALEKRGGPPGPGYSALGVREIDIGPDAVAWTDPDSGSRLGVRTTDVRQIRLRSRPVLEGAAIGFAVGLVIGAVSIALVADRYLSNFGDGTDESRRVMTEGAIVGGIVGAPIGVLVGIVIAGRPLVFAFK